MAGKAAKADAPEPVILHIQTVAVDQWDDDGDQLYRVSANVDGEDRQAFVKQATYDAVPKGDALGAFVRSLFTVDDGD